VTEKDTISELHAFATVGVRLLAVFAIISASRYVFSVVSHFISYLSRPVYTQFEISYLGQDFGGFIGFFAIAVFLWFKAERVSRWMLKK
jgi:hypothetical protein